MWSRLGSGLIVSSLHVKRIKRKLGSDNGKNFEVGTVSGQFDQR